MGFELKQSLKLTQQLLMTPQLQQAIKLLQLSRMELEQFVASQMQENPVLEEGQLESQEELRVTERERERTEKDAVSEALSKASDIVDKTSEEGGDKQDVDWEAMARYQEAQVSSPTGSTRNRSGDDDHPNYENMVTRSATLQDHLMQQIGELDFDDKEKDIATQIIGNIDERGYLTASNEELMKGTGANEEELEDVLDTVQRLEPQGVAARDLKECLLLQLRNQHLKNGCVEHIVTNHLPELENRNFGAIAKAMKIPLEQVIENVQIIAELEPVPGRQFGGDDAHYVIPDVYVFKLGDEWVVNLNEDGLPQLRISDFYLRMLEESRQVEAAKAESKAAEAAAAPAPEPEKKEEPAAEEGGSSKRKGEEQTYINDKVKSAEWLIKSIRQRQRTIFKVTESIVERQKDFFEYGVEHLKPMILKDIAEDIGMHESTISRVTNNKYVHTPRGVFELKYFFNSSVTRADGQDMASESVKRMIADIVKNEDTKRPYSDQKIVEMLEEKGIQLARRTVAKYREQLGILPSSKRKKYF